MATLAATGQDAFHHSFFPFPTAFAYTPPEDAGALEKALDGSVCALLLELVQGEGGVNVLSRALRANRRRALRRAGYSAAHRRGADRQRPQRHALRV